MNGIWLAAGVVAGLAVAGKVRGSAARTMGTTKKVVKAWQAGRSLGNPYAGSSLWTDGTMIYSYKLVVAERRPDGETVLWRWAWKDSTPTTAKSISKLRQLNRDPISVDLSGRVKYLFDRMVDPQDPPAGYEPPNTPEDLGVWAIGQRSGRPFRGRGSRAKGDRLEDRVVQAWAQGEPYEGRLKTLWTDGTRIYSYKLVLAERRPDGRRVFWRWLGVTPTTNAHVAALDFLNHKSVMPLLDGREERLFTDMVSGLGDRKPPKGLEPPNTPEQSEIPPAKRAVYRGPRKWPGVARPRRGGFNLDGG